MSLQGRSFVAFSIAAAVAFGLVVIVAAVSLRAQGRGKAIVPLLVKLAITLGVSGCASYWLGARLHHPSLRSIPTPKSAETAVFVLIVACIGYAVWSLSRAISPSQARPRS